MLFMPRKHVFINPGIKPMPGLAPNWIGYTCKHCGNRSGLDAWQIAEMPLDMALCPNSRAPRMGIFERLFGSVDCYGEPHGLKTLNRFRAALRATK